MTQYCKDHGYEDGVDFNTTAEEVDFLCINDKNDESDATNASK